MKELPVESRTGSTGGRHVGPLIMLSILAGLVFPFLTIMKPALPWLLGLLLFAAYMREGLSVRGVLKKISISYIPVSILLMLLAGTFLSGFLEGPFKAGFIMASFTPPALGAPVVAAIIGADLEMVVGNVLVMNLLAPFYMALAAFMWLPADAGIGAAEVFVCIAPIAILPLLTALIFRKVTIFLKPGQFITSLTGKMGPWILSIVVMTAVSSAAVWLRALNVRELLLNVSMVGVLVTISYVFGALLHRKSCGAGALIFGHRNSGLTIYLALASFGGGATVPMVIYMIFHHMINSFLMFFACGGSFVPPCAVEES